MLVALLLPFAPVIIEQTTVTWPVPGRPVVSSTALFAPYRPAELTVIVPCSALHAAAADRERVVTVLATGPPGDGLVLRTEAGTVRLLLGRRVVSSTPVAGTTTECRTRLHAGPAGTTSLSAPRKRSAITTDQVQGGNFAALRPFDHLYEVPTRLAGHPDIDWGTLQFSADPAARDAYQRTISPIP